MLPEDIFGVDRNPVVVVQFEVAFVQLDDRVPGGLLVWRNQQRVKPLCQPYVDGLGAVVAPPFAFGLVCAFDKNISSFDLEEKLDGNQSPRFKGIRIKPNDNMRDPCVPSGGDYVEAIPGDFGDTNMHGCPVSGSRIEYYREGDRFCQSQRSPARMPRSTQPTRCYNMHS